MTTATTTTSSTPAPASALWHLERIVESMPVAGAGSSHVVTQEGIHGYGVDVVRKALSMLPTAVIDDVR